MLLASYFHSLSPFALRISGDFGIRWYGLAYLCGFLVAYLTMRAIAKRKLIQIPYDRIGDAMLWLIGGTLLGGRLGYALVYDQALLFGFTNHAPWWRLLAINEGGMASHGAIVGLLLAGWVVSRGFKDANGKLIGRTTWMHVMDVVALAGPAGLFFGRIANFINGELLGAIVSPPGSPGPRWTVQYPQEIDLCKFDEATHTFIPGPHLQQTPEQWQKILDLARSIAPRPGLDTLRDGIHTLAHEGWKYADQLRPLISARHPSQLYQALAEGPIIALVLWAAWAKPRKPGIIGAFFLITYGILRIITEIWRLPDAQFADPRPYGLSRGQWLSAAMLGAGIAILIWCRPRAAPKLGGWLTPSQSQGVR